ncbi:MAG: hypothetical protein IKZ04_00640, partial [Spirochaetaceae bacterium]|nr:hypothetical protein [Spirochaetaceae bacterium]
KSGKRAIRLDAWAESTDDRQFNMEMQKDTKNDVKISVEEKDGKWSVKTNLYDVLPEMNAATISTETLGMAFEPEQMFENPNGSPIVFNTDFFGNHRNANPTVGPFENGNSEIAIN